MWVLVMFDLPVGTKAERHAYRKFHEKLERSAYIRLQYSVYARACGSDENAQTHKSRIEKHLPEKGRVRILMLTDLQFGRMESFFGKKKVPKEQMPEQLSFF